ncbi:hypothetical protein I203_103626 [Kwoniella mangroviensis CBS 8507]|uniref:uncharacterized protein n=1 Tax=Kwoniella mangroviensis CBS 8507 TaxID=1296122 RepID=UPI00080D7E1F|nr:uncharacterized protein I203_04278 [Kwoniella mangroviensis CBS 8507]OCF66702.1 hypothetical protein I203_04278 [Kwoniella mangroviensis CBS 8507]
MPPTRTTTNKTPRKPAAHPIASSSKHTLDAIPSADVTESITADYVYKAVTERKGLNEEERSRLIHELVGFQPRKLCDDISEVARQQVYVTISAIESWAREKSNHNPKYETELITGLVALETLLESHVDKAFDKFTAWVLRNAFEFSPELEVVLPWQKGLDFQRGEYVANLPKGQDTLDENLDEMRLKVEQARLLAHKLDLAEEKLDRRINIAKQRKAEVGFIKQVIDSAGLNSLDTPAQQFLPTLLSLQESLKPLEPSSSTIGTGMKITPNQHTKAWELGRSAYLNWALGKVILNTTSSSTIQSGEGGGGDKLIDVESEIKQVIGDENSKEDVEKLLGNL